MKHLVIFASLVLVLSALCCVVPTRAETEIYRNVVRLHVVANSDGERDQETKLAVRDAVLGKIGDLTAGAADSDGAALMISESIGDIRSLVDAALIERGENAAASVTLSEEYYPEKTYGDVTLPAGKYTSLRIRLGRAEGHNWWCVLFPAVCTSAAKASSVFKQTGFSTEQINVLTEDEKPVYKIKFKILELFGGYA